MKQEDYLSEIRKQQSLIRRLITSRRRRAEIIDELTQERYEHLRGRFFKADGEHFGGYKGCTIYIAGIHSVTKDKISSVLEDSDEVKISVTCRVMGRNMPFCGITYETGKNGGLDFDTTVFTFAYDEDIDAIFAPLYVSREKALEEFKAMYDSLMSDFLMKR